MPLVIAVFLSIGVRVPTSRIYILHVSGVYLPKINSSKVCLRDSRNMAVMDVLYR